MKSEKRKIFTRFFVPRYDELALYLMSGAFVILLLIDSDLKSDLESGFYWVVINDFFFQFIMIGIVIFFIGMTYSLYHAFTTRQKTDWERTAMLFFAVMVNSLAGIAAGVHILKDSQGLLMIFPLWNIVNSIILLYLYKSGIVNDTCIVDFDATLLQVFLGTIVVIIFILVCTLVFDTYWATTFSICVAYSCNVNGMVQSIILGTHHADVGSE